MNTYLYTNTVSECLHPLETTQTFISGGMVTQTVMGTYGEYSATKAYNPLLHAKTRTNVKKHYAKYKKPDPKFYKRLDSIYITFWKNENLRYGNEISSCQGRERREGLTESGAKVLFQVTGICSYIDFQ